MTEKILIWCTDLHFDHVSQAAIDNFLYKIRESRSSMLLIAGDIATSRGLKEALKKLHDSLNIPIYFVLGNHDFYGSSISALREEITVFSQEYRHLHYLTSEDWIKIDEHTALIGDDGWADGIAGNYARSKIILNDYNEIEELSHISHEKRGQTLQELGKQAKDRVEGKLNQALKHNSHVIFMTHVPPFLEGAKYQNKFSSADWAPHFVCYQMGSMLLKVMEKHPNQKLTVLSGHSHHRAFYRPTKNVSCYTAHAEYGHPKLEILPY